MIQLSIDANLKDVCPQLVVGCIQADVTVYESHSMLKEELAKVCQKMTDTLTLKDVLKIKNIHDARAAYKRMGKDPSRYRISSEALLRRIVKDKGLYQINNIVDINNLISIGSYCPVCAYDIEKIDESVILRIGDTGEAYYGIGRGMINIEAIPVFADSNGSFGSTTSDCERAMVTEGTEEILMCIVSFNGGDKIKEYLDFTEKLLVEFAEGKNIKRQIIT